MICDDDVFFLKTLSRRQLPIFVKAYPRCCAVIKGCATARHGTRMLTGFGREVRLIMPKFVRSYVKTQKNDMVNAEAIVEVAARPSMRFAEIKTIEQQGPGMAFHPKDLLGAFSLTTLGLTVRYRVTDRRKKWFDRSWFNGLPTKTRICCGVMSSGY